MRSNKLAYGLAIVGSALFFGALQWGPVFADPDSYYHARISQLMAEQGLLYEFPWLSATSLAESFTDQHLLYHLLLIPFIYFLDPIIAVKVAQVVFLTILTVVLLAVLRSWRLPYSGTAVALLYLIGPFLFRINLVKATALAMVFLLSITALLLHKRYRWAALLTIGYTWVHGGFILAIVVGGVIWIAETISTSLHKQRIVLGDPRVLWTTVGGVILGLIANPYFPHNLGFLWQQLVQIGFVNYAGEIQVGAEWYPFSPSALLSVASILIIACIAALLIVIQRRKELLNKVPVWALGILSLVFFVATLRSRRYIEYLIPFAWLWSAYIVLPYIASGQAKRQLVIWRGKLGKWFTIFQAYIILAVVITWTVSLSGVWSDLHDGFEFNQYAAASTYLSENASPGAIIFNGDWDDFPMLFYHNPYNYYIVGLDATFMYLHDKEQYALWRKLGSGDIRVDVVKTIMEEFKAEYVFIDRNDESTKLFDAYLLRDSDTELEFEDDDTRVYHIIQNAI